MNGVGRSCVPLREAARWSSEAVYVQAGMSKCFEINARKNFNDAWIHQQNDLSTDSYFQEEAIIFLQK